jgi:hypothetical protein
MITKAVATKHTENNSHHGIHREKYKSTPTFHTSGLIWRDDKKSNAVYNHSLAMIFTLTNRVGIDEVA